MKFEFAQKQNQLHMICDDFTKLTIYSLILSPSYIQAEFSIKVVQKVGDVGGSFSETPTVLEQFVS